METQLSYFYQSLTDELKTWNQFRTPIVPIGTWMKSKKSLRIAMASRMKTPPIAHSKPSNWRESGLEA